MNRVFVDWSIVEDGLLHLGDLETLSIGVQRFADNYDGYAVEHFGTSGVFCFQVAGRYAVTMRRDSPSRSFTVVSVQEVPIAHPDADPNEESAPDSFEEDALAANADEAPPSSGR